MKRICVFCGSRIGNNPEYAEQAKRLGETLVKRGYGLVFGAGHIGLMGVLADAVRNAGGETIGVIPRALVDRELADRNLTELRIVETMHERKATMAELSDAFIAMPGGYGTLDETFEMLTWAQLGFHRKPIGMLNTAGYFDALLAWIERAIVDNFVKEKNRALLIVDNDVPKLVDRLSSFSARTTTIER
ncbi:MAG: TIGR00730 family Rossman fold protein [Planctomycetes bacterium]|nr:TIGR00730 family Rossman fold protein [Planctomycetota bacterium]